MCSQEDSMESCGREKIGVSMYELYNSEQRLLLEMLESVPGSDGERRMICIWCDHVLDGEGMKLVSFAPDEETIKEYYCSTGCLVAAHSPMKRKRWWSK